MMAKKKQQKKSRFKIKLMPDGKPERIVYFIFVGIVLVIAFILISRQIERIKFLTLDNRMQTLTADLQAIDPDVKWKYEKGCKSSNAFGDQRSSCRVVAGAQTEITSMPQYATLLAGYAHSFESTKSIKVDSNSFKASKEKNGHILQKTNESFNFTSGVIDQSCGYRSYLRGTLDSHLDDNEGDEIVNSPAIAVFSFSCSGDTKAHWFDRIDTTVDFEKKADLY